MAFSNGYGFNEYINPVFHGQTFRQQVSVSADYKF